MIKNKKEILIAIKERYCHQVKMGELPGLCLVTNTVLYYVTAKDLRDFKKNFLEVRRPKNLRYITSLLIKGIRRTPLKKFTFIDSFISNKEEYAAYWWNMKDTVSRIEFLDKLIDTYTIIEGMELLYNYVSLFKEDSSELPGLTDILYILPLKKEDTFLLMFYLIHHESVFTLMFFKNKSILFKKGLYDDKKRYLKYHINKLKQSLQ